MGPFLDLRRKLSMSKCGLRPGVDSVHIHTSSVFVRSVLILALLSVLGSIPPQRALADEDPATDEESAPEESAG